jgi:hypothetical protein
MTALPLTPPSWAASPADILEAYPYLEPADIRAALAQRHLAGPPAIALPARRCLNADIDFDRRSRCKEELWERCSPALNLGTVLFRAA